MFQLDSDIYTKSRNASLAERIGGQSIAASKQEMGLNDEKLKSAKIGRAVKYLSMATPENWGAIRSQAIAEGLGNDQTIPQQYDANWVNQTKTAFAEHANQLPTSAIQNYTFAQRLGAGTPEEKKFSDMVRFQPYLDVGGSMILPDRTGGVREEITKTIPPEQTPATKGAQAEATAIGTTTGKAQGAIETKTIQAPQIEGYLQMAEKLLPEATSGGLQTMGKTASEFVGRGTEGGKIDTQLDVIGAALTASVPRMEGPQSDYDVLMYKKAAGDLANTQKPTSVRLAAIKTMREINNKYAKAAPNRNTVIQPPGGAPAPSGPTPGSTVNWNDF